MTASRTIAVCTWSLKAQDPEALVEALATAGIDAVQLALSPVVRDCATWGRVAETLEAAGIRILSGMMAMEGEDYSTLESIAATGGVRPTETWPANLEHAEDVAALAAELGLDLVTFHAGFIPETSGAERESLLERLRDVADRFRGLDVRLGLETGQETAETLAAALDELAMPSLGVNFDPANMILYGMGDPVAAIERLADRVVQVHVKDARPTTTPGTWGSEVPVGDGAVDWPAFLRVADRLAVPYVIEREAGEGRLEDVRRAAALLREPAP